MLIIFGTRGVTYSRGRGTFFCPSCNLTRSYDHKGVRRFFTLFFIPVLPLDLLGEYVECEHCRATFKVDVLSYDPEAEKQGAEAVTLAVFQVAIRRVMTLMMMADKRIENSEIEIIKKIYSRVTGTYLSDAELREDIGKAEESRTKVIPFLRTVMPFLNIRGKEAVVKAALMVAASDGAIQEEEKIFLEEMASALELSTAHVKGVLSEMSNPAVVNSENSFSG